MARGDAPRIAGSSKLSKEERASLEAMKASIERRLEADSIDGDEVMSDPASDPITIESTDDADTTMSLVDDEPEKSEKVAQPQTEL